jgi:hypothetical protein
MDVANSKNNVYLSTLGLVVVAVLLLYNTRLFLRHNLGEFAAGFYSKAEP